MLFSRYNTTNTPPFIFTRIRYCESFFMTQMINCFFEDCLKSSKTWRKNYKNLLSRNKRQQLWKARVKWYMWRIWTIIKSKENWHDAFAKNRNEGYLSEGYWKYHFLWYFFVVGIFRFSSSPLPSPRMSLWLRQTLNYSGLIGVLRIFTEQFSLWFYAWCHVISLTETKIFFFLSVVTNLLFNWSKFSLKRVGDFFFGLRSLSFR